MSVIDPEAFAREWIAAWNCSDVEAVLAHFSDDAVFVSPLAAAVTGNPEVRGKDNLRAYWTQALKSLPFRLQFVLESFAWDDKHLSLLIIFTSIEPGRAARKCELMHFRPDGMVSRGEGFSGSVLATAQGLPAAG